MERRTFKKKTKSLTPNLDLKIGFQTLKTFIFPKFEITQDG
jgi:hypothetical protein